MSNPPLPDGWIQQYDARHKRHYWVDTKAVPARSTWVHPFEDEQFLREHPDIAENLARLSETNLSAPPPYMDGSDMRRHSWAGGGKPVDIKKNSSSDVEGPSASSSAHPERGKSRGIFGKWKDKAIEMKEEHEENKRRKAELAAQERRRELDERTEYFRAHGGYAPYTPSYPGGRPEMYSYGPPRGEPTFGAGNAGNAALAIGAGLVGGMLLGDMFGGGLF